MSDTPRTDAQGYGDGRHPYVPTDFARQLERELTSVRHDRDEWKAKFVQQNKDLGCEMMDPNGTIWEHAAKVQQQRDKLAEALRELCETLGLSDEVWIAAVKGGSDD